jgi:LysM repeat protein
MKKLLTVLILLVTMAASAHKTDSVGTKMKNGTFFILHKVEKGDGLYGISKKYGVSLTAIIAENPGSDEVVKLDQVIWIPTDRKPVMKDKVVTDYFKGNTGGMESANVKLKDSVGSKSEVTTFAKYHKVELGETLYAISIKYSTTVEMIKTLNGLESNELSEGQRILVQDGMAKTIKVDKEQVVETDYERMKEEMKKSEYEDRGFDTEVQTSTAESSSGYSIKVEKLVEYNIEKVEEKGTAEVGGSDIPVDKNFALHFNAPIGTVIMVTNPVNKNTVFVKVTGNFKRQEGSALILKMSESSATLIGVKSKEKILLSYAR